MNETFFILAGGASSRMGTNKALLPVGNKTEIAHLVDYLRDVTSNIVIVTNDFDIYEDLNVSLIEDLRKGYGPLAGIESALTFSQTENNFILACDMPFIDVDFARMLLKCLETHEAAIPCIDGVRHPLFAAYKKSTLPKVRETLDQNDRKISFYLDKMNVKYVTRDEFPELEDIHLFNMNTPSEYEQVKHIFDNREINKE